MDALFAQQKETIRDLLKEVKEKDQEIKELKEQVARLKDPIAFHKPLYQGKVYRIKGKG
jgi:cell shape-determining protein MreC